ncbi:MAG: fibronectin type III domain-containing protein [Bacteroidales bacterium]|nr:fibronectin type III domain-containing protein [Bacteroidales bacterium]
MLMTVVLAAMLVMPAVVNAQRLAPVAGLRVESSSINSVTVAWDVQAGVQSYVVEYGLHGFAEGSGTRVSVAQTQHITIPQLRRETCYDVYVSANYGGWGLGPSTMVEAVTLFEPYALPWRCGFEVADVNGDWSFSNNMGGNSWLIGHNAVRSGDSALYVSNMSGQRHDSNSYGNVPGTVYAWIGLSFDSAGTYGISFDWRLAGEEECDYMRVALVGATVLPEATMTAPTNGMGYASLPAGWVALDGGHGMGGSAQWSSHTANFAVDSAGLYKLVLCWVNNNSRIAGPPAAVDNIRVERAECAAAEGLRLTHLTHDEALVEWFGGMERGWVLEYGEAGGTVQRRTSTDTSLHLVSLQPNTRYEVRVMPICGYSDTGMAVSLGFTTCCAPVQIPYEDGFHGGSCIQWRGGTVSTRNNTLTVSGGTTYVLFPTTAVGTDSLRFFMRYRMQNTEQAALTLGYMDNLFDESSFRPLASLGGDLMWTTIEHDFGYDGPAGRNGHIALRYSSPGDYALTIDTVAIGMAAGCRKASSVAVTAVGSTWATLQWRVPGRHMLWQVEYGRRGYTPFGGDALLSLLTTDNSITLRGLAASTDYDVYVRPVCSDGDTGVAVRRRVRTSSQGGYTPPAVVSPNCGQDYSITAHLPLSGEVVDGTVWQYYDEAGLTAADFGECDIHSISLYYGGIMEDSIEVQVYMANGQQSHLGAMTGVASATLYCVPQMGQATIYLNTPYHYQGVGDITIAFRCMGHLDTVEWGDRLTMRLCNSFGPTEHNVYADYNPLVGRIEGLGRYTTNSIAMLRAVPLHGYRFAHWGNGDTNSVLPLIVHRDTMLSGISFVFDSFDITALSNNISAGSVRGRRRAAYMEQVTLTAVPSAGYHFRAWGDGSTANPRTISVMGDTVVAVFFAIDTYQVNITSNYGGTATGSGRYAAGDTVTAWATADSGYHFYHWDDGSTENPRRFVATADTAIQAQFVSGMAAIEVSCDSTMGRAYGSGLYTTGQQISIYVVPRQGFRFVRWSDGAITNRRNISVDSDATYIATLVADWFNIVTRSADTVRGFTFGDTIVQAGSTVTITAVPRTGYMFVAWQDGSTANPRVVDVSADAIYTASFANALYRVRVDYDTSRGAVTLATPTATGTTLRVGSGFYGYGDTVSLTATAASGYRFESWDDASTSATRLFRVEGDTVLVASFVANRYIVYVHSDNESLGTVSGYGTYDYGSTLTIAAQALRGYKFARWNDGNTDNPRLVTVSGNAYYTAYFERATCNVTVLSDNLMQGSAVGGGTFLYGDTATITASALQGSRFTSWSDGSTLNPRRIRVTGNTYLIARFTTAIRNVRLTCNDTSMGSVIGGGSYSYGTTAVLIATPKSGHRFSHWSDGITSSMRSMVVTVDTSIVAIFTRNGYRVTAYSACDSMGSTTGSGTYSYGDTAVITAVPAPGYHFTGWSNGSANNPLRVVVTGDMAFTASFSNNLYVITALSSNDTMGYTYGSGSYTYGTMVSLTAVPRQGYRFVGWSDGVQQNPRTFAVSADLEVTAIFRYGNCILTVVSNDTTMGVVTGGGYYSAGSTATITALSNTGYHFSAWNDGNTLPLRNITVNSDTTFTAIFEPDVITVSTEVNNQAWGLVMGGGNYQYGQTATIEAVPASHCSFLHWDDDNTDNPRLITVTTNVTVTAVFARESYSIGGTPADQNKGYVTGSGMYYYGDTVYITAVGYRDYAFARWEDGSTENPRRILVSSDESHTATFVDAYYTVTLSANDSTQGRVHGSGTYPYQHYLTISAAAEPGYRFVRWSDNNTERIRSFVVDRDVTLQAVFARSNGIEQADEAYTVYTYGNEIVVEGYHGPLAIYDAVGRVVVRDSHGTTVSRRYRMPATGVYMVKTDPATPPQKVLVVGK